ncbi:hypothetical protein KIN20_030246 [Parelaphostrongylus tenuis]|uniref:Uncharacterized protein n=1 Tax=Parelaphostrongylus tenuis TaxID=148309 RepID=A0AAD5R3I5_PARTN|nr:hypothetical protein KIN20_030246 [Parelaphostrongylus tenuis]
MPNFFKDGKPELRYRRVIRLSLDGPCMYTIGSRCYDSKVELSAEYKLLLKDKITTILYKGHRRMRVTSFSGAAVKRIRLENKTRKSDKTRTNDCGQPTRIIAFEEDEDVKTLAE